MKMKDETDDFLYVISKGKKTFLLYLLFQKSAPPYNAVRKVDQGGAVDHPLAQ